MKKLTRVFMLISLSFFMLIANIANAQQRTITGTVTNSEDGTGLPGVSVSVKGTTIGTATDIDGKYTLKVGNDAQILVFSSVGMKTKEITIGASNNISVAMEPETIGVDEVVVTAIGISREKKALGYSVTSVDNESLTESAPTSAMDALKGKVAGVNITSSSGAPGASTKVVLRGYSSIAGNNQPLYVVDGSPINNSRSGTTSGVTRSTDFGNAANDINPNDIENISILKGASATALYGSRAANGVILITTKKGKKGDIKINYNGAFEWSEPLRLPSFQNKYGQGWSGHWATDENGSWGPEMDGVNRYWGNTVDGERLQKPFSAQENNMKDFYEKGFNAINSLNVSGGNEKANFFASVSNATNDGIVPTDADSYKRNTIGLRGSLIGKWIKVSSNLNFVNKNQKFVPTGYGDDAGSGKTMFQEIIQIPRDFSIVDMKDYNNKFYNLDNFYTPYAQNPYFSIYENGNNFKSNRVYGNISTDLNFVENLTFTYRLGYDYTNNFLEDWGAKAIIDNNSPNGGANDVVGAYEESGTRRFEINHDFLANYDLKINDDFDTKFLVGFNANERMYKNFYAKVTDLDIDGFYSLKNTTSNPTVENRKIQKRLYGVFGQLDLSFRNYLFLSLLARNDWSSTLPKDNNSFFYPGVNLGFIVTEAVSELKNYVDYLKVRASWGKTGNDADPYSINSVFIPSIAGLGYGQIKFPFGGVNAFEKSNLIGNQKLQPEITSEYEVGLDLRVLDSRIGLDFAYYDRTTTDQILSLDLAPSTGYGKQTVNFGKVNNKGIELALTLVPVRTNELKWEMTYTFSKNKNEVLELNEDLDVTKIKIMSFRDIEFVAMKGQPIGTYLVPKPLTDGKGHQVVSSSGFPQMDPKDKDVLGQATPDYVMGLSNRVTYDNFSLSFNFDYRKGGYLYSYTDELTGFVGNSQRTLYNDRKPFVVPNSVQKIGNKYVENSTPINMTRFDSYNYVTSNKLNELHQMLDRTYLKLRDVTLSYKVPNKLLEKIRVSDCIVSIYGKNLFLWTPETNSLIDPETSTFGNDLRSEFGEIASGPTTRIYGFSVKLKL